MVGEKEKKRMSSYDHWSIPAKRFRIGSDLHLWHKRIPTYCRRLEFMNEGELKNFLEAEKIYQAAERVWLANPNEKTKEAKVAANEAMRQLRYSKETIDRMNSTILNNINAVAGPDDVIFLLGDVIFGDISQLRQARARIVCQHLHLIFGNHDKEIRRLWKQGDLRDVFETAQEVARINVDGQGLWLSHYAHVTWDKARWGVWHCYAHSHGSLEKWREIHLPDAKMVDVGVDYRAQLGKGYTLWNFDELKKFMDKKGGQPVDHHE